MTVHNAEIARQFNLLADLLEIEDANPFRVRAYRNAARIVEGMAHSVAEMVERGEDLSEIYGIGEDLARKIEELVKTGELSALQDEEKRVPVQLTELMRIDQLGPRRVKQLYRELGIKTLADLSRAAKAGKVQELEGFGEKTEAKILAGLEQLTSSGRRTKLSEATEIAESLADYLRGLEGISKVTVAGSYRRRKETVGDLDLLAVTEDGAQVMNRFVDYPEVEEVVSKGTTRSTVRLRTGLQVDLRLVPGRSYGAALCYFTGSKAHNVEIRTRAAQRGLKLNEYGLFKDNEYVAGRTEKSVYEQVGLAYIEPELRENTGEVEAAEAGQLPELVTMDDIRGDLHAHTNATDGHATLREMARAAADRGYEYLAITDHSKRVTMARGLDEKRLRKQLESIDALNDELRDITLLKGCEVDILEDGQLDLPDSVLEELDLTVCSVHYHRELSRKKQTERIIRAMDDPCFTILGHPTGRLINEREPYEVDMEALMEEAAERGCHMELNAQPSRFDLIDAHRRMARDMGVKVAICTDAHSTDNLDYMRFGVEQARRGWLTADDIINTRRLPALRKLLRRA
ncbi:DNA polymerase/3'-5' exonuclease PolX [Ectothiorhodospiraceae bacterium WFHF3C12]|nr:DNA polymerase/3'-5' exonuclease PolX [Ectothiorhodospiraceae bacterium WFHF3C12]